MSLNKYMHPRNRYKNVKPSFLKLALKYPYFRAVTTQNESGKVFLDFKDANALRALTRCLLKEDFDLSVELPLDRLVPTLPLRLNYIHWLEDIIGTDHGKWGIDIGTGASCIYPLLASKMNKWKFLATESDAENFYHAKKNVEENGLSHLIQVRNVSDESILTATLESFCDTDKFDFCMCNPPFFADHMEAQGLTTSRSTDRPEAGSVSTASPQECIVSGGEVAFIQQMIVESTVLRDKIRVYSSMVGKKSSLTQIKEELRHQKIFKYCTTDFCQGKTMRWGVAWTFDPSVCFPRSEFESRKQKPPLQFTIPKGSGGVEYEVHELAGFLQQVMESIKVHCYQGKQAKAYTSITLTAAENTWCHQRRLRRQRQHKSSEANTDKKNTEQDMDEVHHVEAEAAHNVSEVGAHSGNRNAWNTNDVVKEQACSGEYCETKNLEEYKVIKACEQSTDQDNSVIKTSQKRQLNDTDGEDDSKPKRLKFEDCVEKSSLSEDSNLNAHSSQDVSIEADAQTGSLKPNDLTLASNVEEIKDKVESCNSLSAPINTIVCFNEDASVCTEKNFENGNSETGIKEAQVSESMASSCAKGKSQPKDYILKCVLRLRRAGEVINLELEWLDGKSRELLHQVFTFIKNKLSQQKP